MKKGGTMLWIFAALAVLQVVNGILHDNLDDAAIAGAITAVGAAFGINHHNSQVEEALYTPVPEVPEGADLPQPRDGD